MEKLVLTSLDDIKVYSDPYRLQILFTFNKLNRPATVKEIADDMGEVPAKIHYHVKKLEKIGMLKLVATKEINGIVAKYYESFAGEVQISQKDVAEPVRKMIVAEAQKLLSEIFEQSRKKLLKSTSEGNRLSARVANKNLYMTDDEATELMEKLTELTLPYEKKREGLETQTYDLLISVVREVTE